MSKATITTLSFNDLVELSVKNKEQAENYIKQLIKEV